MIILHFYLSYVEKKVRKLCDVNVLKFVQDNTYVIHLYKKKKKINELITRAEISLIRDRLIYNLQFSSINLPTSRPKHFMKLYYHFLTRSHQCRIAIRFLLRTSTTSIMANLIFDLMDLNYGMNSMKDSSVVLLINLKKN